MKKSRILKPIDATTLKDSVYRALFQAIISGRLLPGERIALEPLAKQLDVSIMPVREALRKLEADRLVTVRNRKITVNSLTVTNVKDILKVRLILEGSAVSEAAIVAELKTVSRLERFLTEMEQAEDAEGYLKANRAFHYALYKECNNPMLLEVIESVWERYSPYLHILLEDQGDFSTPVLVQHHYGMLEAYRKRDRRGIRRCLEKDLSEAAQRIMELIDSSEASDSP